MDYRMTEKEHGMPVKTYLRTSLRLSGAQITALKKDPVGILVNGAHVTVRYVLQAGDVLSLATDDTDSSDNIVPVEMPLTVLYEDDAIMVLNKPPFMPTHPSHGHYEDTLANGLAYLFAGRQVPFVFRSCSRLDRDTSGLVTVAKTRAAAHSFQRAHVAGAVDKEYLCVLVGHLTPEIGEIGGCIKRQENSVITRIVTEDDGAPALTRYRVLAYGTAPDGRELTLCAAQPITGRTHQLRVHFAHLGCPMLGDFLYGEEHDALIGRQALHCHKTAFAHPTSGRRMTLYAALPDDFLALMQYFDFDERTAMNDAENRA